MNYLFHGFSQIDSEESEELPPSSNLPDMVLYADPPWSYSFSTSKARSIEKHYDTMTLDEIKNLSLPYEDNAVLYLWATAPKLIEALDVMAAWRFVYKTHMIWDKRLLGMGYWFRGQHELLLVGTRGSVSPPRRSSRVSSVFEEQRGKHSKKPDRIRELIETWYPDAERWEFFAREKWPGWKTFGNETQKLLWGT